MKVKFVNRVLLLVLSLLMINTLVLAQGTEVNSQSFSDFLSLQNKGSLKRAILSKNDIKGSAYLNEDFIKGYVLTLKNVRYEGVPLRYNIYNDDIEFEAGKDHFLAISRPFQMKEIKIGNDVFIYTDKDNKKGELKGYYKQACPGKVQLLVRYNIVFKEATTTTGYKAAEPARLNRNANTYYIKMGDAKPVLLKSKKDVPSVFKGKSDEVLKFIKKNRTKFRKEGDLVELVKYVNEII